MYRFFQFLLFTSVCFVVCIEGTCWSQHQIEVTKKDNRLVLYEDGTKRGEYPIATGKMTHLTPEGTFTLAVKINEPGWKHVTGGDPQNPLGPRWLGFSVDNDVDCSRKFGIHGTNRPESIGTYASGGCIRMHNQHVVQLAEKISEGTPIWIHNKASIGKWQGNASYGVSSMKSTAKIKNASADVLSGCSRGAFKKASLPQDVVITVTGLVKDWYQVKYQEMIGFMHKNDIQLSLVPSNSKSVTPHTKPKEPTAKKKGKIELPKRKIERIIITVTRANIRKGPSMKASVIQKVIKKDMLPVISKHGNWFYVCLPNGRKAYIHQSVTNKKAA